MVQLGQAYQRVLPVNHREALFAAAEILYDAMLDDLEVINSGAWSADDTREQSIEFSFIAGNLPTRYRLRYTPRFMKRFHLCLLTVIWKLGQREPLKLSSVAEELAAYLLIQQAESSLELDGVQADFASFEDELFEDLDFELLYDDAYDGIEATAIADEIGMANLAFADWFTRFGSPDSTDYLEPHPLCFEDDEEDMYANDETGEDSQS